MNPFDKLRAERDKAIEALQELYDYQNGPPLYKYEQEWNQAMLKARIALAPSWERRGIKMADEEIKTLKSDSMIEGKPVKGWDCGTVTYTHLGSDFYCLEGDVDGLEDHLLAAGATRLPSGKFWRIPKAWFDRLQGTFARVIEMEGKESPEIP